ncbi:MAG: phosphatidylserine/phosphatidylglycerophosphate/cardiolipin synthase family protein [Elusimicrobia bacterium]|nr:phosphatidylserine/phosphatidylglycerophosphate/cardiolipin synthase family protein [Elusimicrobiota bacterium]
MKDSLRRSHGALALVLCPALGFGQAAAPLPAVQAPAAAIELSALQDRALSGDAVDALNRFFDGAAQVPAAVPAFPGNLKADIGAGQPGPSAGRTAPAVQGAEDAAAQAAAEVPSPAGKELPGSFEEFRKVTDSSLPGWLQKLIGWLKMPVDLAKKLHAELLSRRAGTWDEIAAKLESEVAAVAAQAGGASFESPAFVSAFEESLGTRFVRGGRVEPLIDGPASFAKRFELIDDSRETIHILSWALYDDETGYITSQKLIAKARQGVKVRIIVDEQVSFQEGKGGRLFPYLEDAGVLVVRWRSPEPERLYHGQHRKVMIVDGKAAIAGGMNFGDDYSHLGRSTKWRDTDVLVEGPAVVQAERLFARIWNEQIERIEDRLSGEETLARRGRGYAPLPMPAEASEEAAGPATALIDHAPGDNGNGLKSILLALEAARSSIDIENAYFIMDPAVQRALVRAKERGVKVRVLTNSAESVDEPVVTYPILKSADAARQEGIEVYLKKGSTLHSKFMVVDGLYCWVGSYNLQPRSHLMEGEMMVAVLDRAFAEQMRAAFEEDISRASKATDPIELPSSLLSKIAYLFFYNQL